MKKRTLLPEHGRTAASLSTAIHSLKENDARWEEGKIFGFVYHPGSDQARISEEYFQTFMYDSTINPSTFPSLRNFEKEIVGMGRELMHGTKNVAGTVTTGGTESIFLALKVARDIARQNQEEEAPLEVILPDTIHPAFIKACGILSIQPVLVPVGEDKRADWKAMEHAITERSIMMCCSAPCFPYGVIDPVEQLGKIAKNNGLMLHVDACMGGFMLPFLEELGYKIPLFDFRVPGVTSISMDAHKYGYAPKGTSIVLYRNREMRKKQFFVHTDWPGGIFASTTFMGTKSGGPVAGCWAIMNHLGREGYRKMAWDVMKTTEKIREGISSFDKLEIISSPDMSVMAFTSKDGNIYNIGDALEQKGWHLDRLQFPEALHITVTQLNVGHEEDFLADLSEILGNEAQLRREKRSMNNAVRLLGGLSRLFPGSLVEKVAKNAGSRLGDSGSGSGGGQAALYGMSATFRNRKSVKNMVENLMDGLYDV